MEQVVQGLEQWRARLKEIELAIHIKAEYAIGAAVGENYVVSKRLTPVGKRTYTRGEERHPGYLKSRNSTRMIERGPYRYIGEYFNDAPYAAAVAFGSLHESSLGKIYHIAAQDFVTPGFFAGRKKLIERMERAVR